MLLHSKVQGISPMRKGNSHDLNQRQHLHLTMEDLQQISGSESKPQWHNTRIVRGLH